MERYEVLGSSMWCLVDKTTGNAEVTSLNVLLGSLGVVPEVLEISQLGHYVAEHLVEPRRRSSRTRLVSILGRFDTVLIGPTLVGNRLTMRPNQFFWSSVVPTKIPVT